MTRCHLVFKDAKDRTIPTWAIYGLTPVETGFSLSCTYTGDYIFCRTKREARNIARYLGEGIVKEVQ